MEEDSYYLKSPSEMAEIYQDLPEAISNTNVIADKCKVEWETRHVVKEDAIFVTVEIDRFVNEILLQEMKKKQTKKDGERDAEDPTNCVHGFGVLAGDKYDQVDDGIEKQGRLHEPNATSRR